MEIIVRGGNRDAKDAHGDRVDFKERYFDKGCRRTFNTAHEKSAYMIKNGMCSTGESDAKIKKENKHAYEKSMDEKRR